MSVYRAFQNAMRQAKGVAESVRRTLDERVDTSKPMSLSDQFEDYIQNTGNHRSLCDQLDTLINSVLHLEVKAKGWVDEVQSQQMIEIDHEEKKRKSKRRDNWIDWAQRTFRWAAGACIAVMLYSTFVYWSNPYVDAEWRVVIPVREWFVPPS